MASHRKADRRATAGLLWTASRSALYGNGGIYRISPVHNKFALCYYCPNSDSYHLILYAASIPEAQLVAEVEELYVSA